MSKDATETTAEPIPHLVDGQRLTRDEFERRYEAMPHVHKAELIEGVVHMPSPVRQEYHSLQHSWLGTWIGLYAQLTPGVHPGDNGTVRLDVVNEPQPDLFLYIRPEFGGQVRISSDGYVEHAPELVAEIAASSVSIDLGAKRDVYARSGVREYLVWRVLDGVLDWLVLRGDAYQPLPPGPDGLYRSEVFPGLWLDPAAVLAGDGPRNLAVLQLGIASTEHAAFVGRLRAAR